VAEVEEGKEGEEEVVEDSEEDVGGGNEGE
jgi:hypothetical protein